MIGLHFSDENFGLQCNRRTIQNFINYSNDSGSFLPAMNQITSLAQIPRIKGKMQLPGLSTKIAQVGVDYATHLITESALQVAIGDSSTREITYTINPSDRPELWVKFIALNTNDVDGIDQEDGSIVYYNIWDGIDIKLQPVPGKIKETIIVNTKILPQMLWSIEYSEQLTMRLENDCLIWKDINDTDVIKTLKPYGRDSSVISLDEGQYLRASISINENGNMLLDLNKDDLNNAILPAMYDPTATISGPTAIEDTYLNGTSSGVKDNNYGGSGWIVIGYPPVGSFVPIVRIDKTLIPPGSITDFRWVLNIGTLQANKTAAIYFVTDANTWVVGTSNGALEIGACDWNHTKHATETWAGGPAGCRTSGTDYDEDGSPPTFSLGSYGWVTAILKTAWATNWRNNTRANNGLVCMSDITTNIYARWYPCSDATYPQYFTINYISSSKQLFWKII